MNKIDYCYRYLLSLLGIKNKLKIIGIYATSDIRRSQFKKNFDWDIDHTVFSDAMEASKTELTVIWGHPSGYSGDYPCLYLAGNNVSLIQNSDITIKGYITFDENDVFSNFN